MKAIGAAVACVLLAPIACGEGEPPTPDISELRVAIEWVDGSDERTVEVNIPNDLPCTGTEGGGIGSLGEDGVECESAPWTLTVDGTSLTTTPVSCTAAHEGLFGDIAKSCHGGRAFGSLPDVPHDDVEIVATTDDDETRLTVPGVRAIHPFVTEQDPSLTILEPAIVWVDDLDLADDTHFARYTSVDDGVPPHELSGHVDIVAADDEGSRMELEAHRNDEITDYADEYDVRIRATARLDRTTRVALVVEGSLSVDEE